MYIFDERRQTALTSQGERAAKIHTPLSIVSTKDSVNGSSKIGARMRLFDGLLTFFFLTVDGWCFLVGHSRRYDDHRYLRMRQHRRALSGQQLLTELLGTRRLAVPNGMKPEKDDEGASMQNKIETAKDRIPGINTLSVANPKECNLDYGLRMDCGYYGIKEEECYHRECCWGETTKPHVPWCYHSKRTIKSACLLDKSERQECGWYGITKDICLYKNCCWQPTNDNSVPWCFQPLHNPVFQGQCGVPLRPPSTFTRIIGGTEAVPYSWPWVVSLQTDGDHLCGGALINDQWILSAAHCKSRFLSSSRRDILLGAHDLKAEEKTKVRREIDSLFTHYNFGKHHEVDNDVMLIKLKEPIHFTGAVIPVCLPRVGQELDPGEHCYTTGWGVLSARGLSPDKLQQVMVPIINSSVCKEDAWYGTMMKEGMICAGYEEGGRDACEGDSGGPLVCYVDGRWTLFGIVSWGTGCAEERSPGVYSKVSVYVRWLENTINLN